MNRKLDESKQVSLNKLLESRSRGSKILDLVRLRSTSRLANAWTKASERTGVLRVTAPKHWNAKDQDDLNVWLACCLGDEAFVRHVIKSEPQSLVAHDPIGNRTPLYYACSAGQNKIVQLLLKAGITDSDGEARSIQNLNDTCRKLLDRYHVSNTSNIDIEVSTKDKANNSNTSDFMNDDIDACNATFLDDVFWPFQCGYDQGNLIDRSPTEQQSSVRRPSIQSRIRSRSMESIRSIQKTMSPRRRMIEGDASPTSVIPRHRENDDEDQLLLVAPPLHRRSVLQPLKRTPSFVELFVKKYRETSSPILSKNSKKTKRKKKDNSSSPIQLASPHESKRNKSRSKNYVRMGNRGDRINDDLESILSVPTVSLNSMSRDQAQSLEAKVDDPRRQVGQSRTVRVVEPASKTTTIAPGKADKNSITAAAIGGESKTSHRGTYSLLEHVFWPEYCIPDVEESIHPSAPIGKSKEAETANILGQFTANKDSISCTSPCTVPTDHSDSLSEYSGSDGSYSDDDDDDDTYSDYSDYDSSSYLSSDDDPAKDFRQLILISPESYIKDVQSELCNILLPLG